MRIALFLALTFSLALISAPAQAVWELQQQVGEFGKLRGHRLDVYNVVYSPDGKYVASASFDGTSRVWDTQTWETLYTFSGHSHWVGAVAWHPNSQQLVSGGLDKQLQVWDMAEGQNLATISDFPKGILTLAWSPDGTTVACGLLNGDIVLVDAAAWKITRTLSGHAGGIAALRYTEDSQTLISVGFDEINIRLWDLTRDKVTRTFTGHTQEVYALALSPDGKTLASGGADKTIRLWNMDSGSNTLTLTGHLEPVWALAFSKNGQTLFSGGVGDKTIRVWELPGGVNTQTLTQVSPKTYGLALSPDGKTLISAHDDKALRLWRDMPTAGSSSAALSEVPAGPQAPKLAITDIRVSDNPSALKSNHNGKWEPGEEAEVTLQVHNVGSAPLGKVVATLEVLTNGVKYLALAPSFEVPQIQPGEKRFLTFTLGLPNQPLSGPVEVRLSLLDDTARHSLSQVLKLAPSNP